MIDQHNYGLSTNNQLCHQHENTNDDVAYWQVLLDVAEQFFNRMTKELEHVSISQIIEAFVSGSMSLQLDKTSIPDSDLVTSMQEKGGPFQ
jgi:hypothetical protein